MARILFTVPPLTGHLNPALAVAAALAARGHELAWAVHAGPLAGRLPDGAKLYPLDGDGSGFDLAADAGAVRGLESVRVFFEDYAIPMARAALGPLAAAIADFRPDAMVVDHQMLAGALAARRAGVPWTTLVTTSASILKMSPAFDDWVETQYRAVQADCLAGADPVARPDFSPHANVVFSVDALVGTTHERVDAPYVFVGPARGQGRRAVDFPWAWLDDTKKKLLISLGTVSRDRDTRFFEVMLEALADMDVQAVMVAPPSLQDWAPANVLVRDYVPQTELLPRLDAVVCHAGHNTVCEALACGLPLGVAPIRDDQPVIARQVIDAGAGVFIRHGKVTPKAARTALDSLLADTALRDNARRLAAALAAAPGAAGAADTVETLIAGRVTA